MDREAWRATVHRVAKSLTQLKWLSTHVRSWCLRNDSTEYTSLLGLCPLPHSTEPFRSPLRQKADIRQFSSEQKCQGRQNLPAGLSLTYFSCDTSRKNCDAVFGLKNEPESQEYRHGPWVTSRSQGRHRTGRSISPSLTQRSHLSSKMHSPSSALSSSSTARLQPDTWSRLKVPPSQV